MPMPKEKRHIEELFSDALPIDERKVVNALRPLVTIQRETKDIHLRSGFKITTEDRILAFGLAKKLLKLRGLIEDEKISASEFHKKTGFKKGSIDPAFKSLKGVFLIGKKREYEIPNYKVDEIAEKLITKYGTRKNQ